MGCFGCFRRSQPRPTVAKPSSEEDHYFDKPLKGYELRRLIDIQRIYDPAGRMNDVDVKKIFDHFKSELVRSSWTLGQIKFELNSLNTDCWRKIWRPQTEQALLKCYRKGWTIRELAEDQKRYWQGGAWGSSPSKKDVLRKLQEMKIYKQINN